MKKHITSPYGNQKEHHFWKTAVSHVKMGSQQFQNLCEPLLSIELGRISSAGSCFAQHVGRWLINNDLDFQQSALTTNQVSSFAFGNIYTPRCFLQWLNLDVENKERYDVYHCQMVDRYFDLLRPTIHPEGFTTIIELDNSRIIAISELFDTISKTQTFIFTLGLTETWKDINETYYPSCPGVKYGEFNGQIYKFHEFNYNEIISDLIQIKNKIKEINPSINIVLTVSPVPLTATATSKNVMVASQYSKSVLRAAAGYFSDHNDDVFYFPSYELITVNNDDDFRFESNKRTVSAQAVNYVMNHFKSSINSKHFHKVQANKKILPISNEVECDDEKLESYVKSTHSKPNDVHPITLIGDSHMGKLSKSFQSLNIKVSGGMIMNGSGFAQRKFSLCESEYFVPLEDPKSRSLWQIALKNLQYHQDNNFINPSVIISNIGLQTHQTISRFVDWLNNQQERLQNPIVLENFVDFFYFDQKEQLSILLALKDKGHQVIVVSDPPFCQHFEESKVMKNLVYAYHSALEYIWSQFDIQFLDAATLFDEKISEPHKYTSKITYADGQHDWIHGNELYYLWLAKEILDFIGQPNSE